MVECLALILSTFYNVLAIVVEMILLNRFNVVD